MKKWDIYGTLKRSCIFIIKIQMGNAAPYNGWIDYTPSPNWKERTQYQTLLDLKPGEQYSVNGQVLTILDIPTIIQLSHQELKVLINRQLEIDVDTKEWIQFLNESLAKATRYASMMRYETIESFGGFRNFEAFTKKFDQFKTGNKREALCTLAGLALISSNFIKERPRIDKVRNLIQIELEDLFFGGDSNDINVPWNFLSGERYYDGYYQCGTNKIDFSAKTRDKEEKRMIIKSWWDPQYDAFSAIKDKKGMRMEINNVRDGILLLYRIWWHLSSKHEILESEKWRKLASPSIKNKDFLPSDLVSMEFLSTLWIQNEKIYKALRKATPKNKNKKTHKFQDIKIQWGDFEVQIVLVDNTNESWWSHHSIYSMKWQLAFDARNKKYVSVERLKEIIAYKYAKAPKTWKFALVYSPEQIEKHIIENMLIPYFVKQRGKERKLYGTKRQILGLMQNGLKPETVLNISFKGTQYEKRFWTKHYNIPLEEEMIKFLISEIKIENEELKWQDI